MTGPDRPPLTDEQVVRMRHWAEDGAFREYPWIGALFADRDRLVAALQTAPEEHTDCSNLSHAEASRIFEEARQMRGERYAAVAAVGHAMEIGGEAIQERDRWQDVAGDLTERLRISEVERDAERERERVAVRYARSLIAVDDFNAEERGKPYRDVLGITEGMTQDDYLRLGQERGERREALWWERNVAREEFVTAFADLASFPVEPDARQEGPG